MTQSFTTAQLEAYLDEGLPVEQMSNIEHALRHQPDLLNRLTTILDRRDTGIHSLGEIWRRARLSCPTREQLGSYLLGVIPTAMGDYITFHIETIGCRYCHANVADLKKLQTFFDSRTDIRRHKFFDSSVGCLKR